MHPIPEFVAAEKRIAAFPGWSAPEPETGYMWFNAPIEIEGVVQEGFALHGGCGKYEPDCHVSFELHRPKITGRRRTPIARVDWRDLKGGHTNPRRRGHPLSGRRVGDSHYHDFASNWAEDAERMLSPDLRFARQIDENLESFQELLAYVGKVFRIANPGIITLPEWESRLI